MLERKLATSLAKDRSKKSRCCQVGDTIIVHPSGTSCGLAMAIEYETGEHYDSIMDRVAAMYPTGRECP